MAIRCLQHVSITTADLDRSLAFWQGLVGLELTGRGEVAAPHLDKILGLGPTRLAWAELDVPGGGMLELFQYLRPEGVPTRPRTCDPGAVHICFETDDLETLVARLREAGVPMRSQGSVEIPSGDWRGWRDIYVEDPDGVTVELSQPPR
jgi:catechol 2,3-dioxygenase-like lactoylglutathione lyase family enzyme